MKDLTTKEFIMRDLIDRVTKAELLVFLLDQYAHKLRAVAYEYYLQHGEIIKLNTPNTPELTDDIDFDLKQQLDNTKKWEVVDSSASEYSHDYKIIQERVSKFYESERYQYVKTTWSI